MEECTTDLLEHIQQCVLSLVLLKEDTQVILISSGCGLFDKQETGELGDLFTKQLEVSLATAVLKFQGKMYVYFVTHQNYYILILDYMKLEKTSWLTLVKFCLMNQHIISYLKTRGMSLVINSINMKNYVIIGVFL